MSYVKDFTTVYTIGNRNYEITAPARFDDETNQPIYDAELDERASEMARQAYRDDMGLLSPTELKKYRAKVGLSQRNLAELTGLSPNTIALYEAGAFPTPANNKTLKYLINDDELLRQYIMDDTNNYSNDLVAKVKAYLQQEDIVVIDQSFQPKFTAVQLANWLRVENYFGRELDENVEPLTQMKLIKLLYFAYGRYLVKTHNKLFTSSIVHLQYGPVITEVHSKFNGLTVLDTGKPSKEAFDDYNLVSKDSDISHLLRLVNEDYINYSASGLSQKTHQPGSPWSLTDDGKIIKDQLIFDTFSNGLEE